MSLFLVPLITGCFNLAGHRQASAASLRDMARNRDVAGLTALLAPNSKNDFPLLKAGGAYGSGSKGWDESDVPSPSGGQVFAVFSTPLTCEDIGSLVYLKSKTGLRLIPETDDFGAKILNHSFHVSFRLEAKEAIISDTCVIRRGQGGLTQIRLSPCYKVRQILEGEREVKFTQGGGVVFFDLPKGDSSLSISYVGVVDLPRFAGSIDSQLALLTQDYWYPMIARYPSPYTIAVTAPKGWTVVAQGDLVKRVASGSNEKWVYNMPLPTSIFSLAAGPFQSTSKVVDGRRYTIWSDTLTSDQMEPLLHTYPPIIDFYSRVFGACPFNHYGALITKRYGGGALEAYSYATYGAFPGEDPHEPSHTWWGGILPNTYLGSFWNESFADYSEQLFHREGPIGVPAAKELAFAVHPNLRGDDGKTPIETAGAASGPIASYMGYGKGADVLAQLEYELGQPTMENCLKSWVSTGRVLRGADWSDFEKVVLTVAGQKWRWFFDQWIRRPGIPHFEVDKPTWKDGAMSMKVSFDGRGYRMKMPVMVVLTDGKSKIVTLETSNEQIQTLTWDQPDRPNLVSVDPYRQMMREFDRDEAPMSIQSAKSTFSRATFRLTKSEASSWPGDLTNVAIQVGANGLSDPKVQKLAESIGFELKGGKVQYKGVEIDLDNGCAEGLTPDGKTLLILGSCVLNPNSGDSYIALLDKYGRFLCGDTHPKGSGKWVFTGF